MFSSHEDVVGTVEVVEQRKPLAIGRGRTAVNLPALPLATTPGVVSKGVAETVGMNAKVTTTNHSPADLSY